MVFRRKSWLASAMNTTGSLSFSPVVGEVQNVSNGVYPKVCLCLPYSVLYSFTMLHLRNLLSQVYHVIQKSLMRNVGSSEKWL